MLENWTQHAKCANDPIIQNELLNGVDRFHDGTPEHQNKFKRYCSDCPVRLACLSEAMKQTNINVAVSFYDDAGIWGGTTQRERRSMKKKTLKQSRQILEQMQALQQAG